MFFLGVGGFPKPTSNMCFIFGHKAAKSCLNYSIMLLRDTKTPCIMYDFSSCIMYGFSKLLNHLGENDVVFLNCQKKTCEFNVITVKI